MMRLTKDQTRELLGCVWTARNCYSQEASNARVGAPGVRIFTAEQYDDFAAIAEELHNVIEDSEGVALLEEGDSL